MKKRTLLIITIIALAVPAALLAISSRHWGASGVPLEGGIDTVIDNLAIPSVPFALLIIIGSFTIFMVKNSQKKRIAKANAPVPAGITDALVYVIGSRSFLWGLINLGVKNEFIEKQFAKYVSLGFEIMPFNKRANRVVLLGLYKSNGWFVSMKKI